MISLDHFTITSETASFGNHDPSVSEEDSLLPVSNIRKAEGRQENSA